MDGDGLALRVKPNGSKLWVFNYYRPYTKKRTAISFGAYPDVSLAQARAKRQAARALLAKQIDPKEHKDEERRLQDVAHRQTLECIAEKWLAVKKTTVAIDHTEDTWRSLALHVFPRLGDLPIHKITAVNAIATLEPVVAKGSLETVKRLCQRLNEIMLYAVNTGIIANNPLSGIHKAFQLPVKQHLPTLTPEQLPLLMRALSQASIKITTRCLIKWQLHTMVRPSEAAGARWDEIDFEKKLWEISAARMKQKKAHVVPLTGQAIALLEVMKPISVYSEFVFPADRNSKTHTHPQTANMALKRMGFANQLVAHGLRSLASTILNEQGFDADVIEAALAHTGKNEVRNAYNRANYLERRKPMMRWWSEYIVQAAVGSVSLVGV